MKKIAVFAVLAVTAVASVAPAEALNVHVGPRGVGVGVGHRVVHRAPVVHRRVIVHRN